MNSSGVLEASTEPNSLTKDKLLQEIDHIIETAKARNAYFKSSEDFFRLADTFAQRDYGMDFNDIEDYESAEKIMKEVQYTFTTHEGPIDWDQYKDVITKTVTKVRQI